MADIIPKVRLGVTVGLTTIVGVLSSIFASQIMPNGKLDWSLSFKMPSFWLLSFTSLALLASQVGFYRRDERLSRFADDAYCLGFIREKKLEAMARLIAVHPEKAELLDVKKLADELGMKL